MYFLSSITNYSSVNKKGLILQQFINPYLHTAFTDEGYQRFIAMIRNEVSAKNESMPRSRPVRVIEFDIDLSDTVMVELRDNKPGLQTSTVCTLSFKTIKYFFDERGREPIRDFEPVEFDWDLAKNVVNSLSPGRVRTKDGRRVVNIEQIRTWPQDDFGEPECAVHIEEPDGSVSIHQYMANGKPWAVTDTGSELIIYIPRIAVPIHKQEDEP